MSLLNKLVDSNKENNNEIPTEKRNLSLEEYQSIINSMSGENKVEINFKQTAGSFWGKIGKVRVLATKETSKGTKYYLVIADIIKDGEKMKLIQEWFVGQDGIAKPALKKNITIPDDYSDEVGMMLMDNFECI